ncbi:hypothetical protein MNBD_NITROSPIRAE03-440 [hydrothermal vent metagenome]|uniref:Uncharacterized protein n=1 Tax=hydrothermal vent metagenome TaxID=652676 RepID=A0A3B1CX86_9ZZZZ
MKMIKRINRQAILVLIPLSLLSALIEWKKLPLSILTGGALALVNLKGLYWEALVLTNPEAARGATGNLLFFSMFRLLIIFIILTVLLAFSLINIFGALTGLTVVFILIMKEGLAEARRF